MFYYFVQRPTNAHSIDSPTHSESEHTGLARREHQHTGCLYNKTNHMYQFHKFILSWNSTCLGHFLCPSSAVYSV